jgi:hypothetical protein
VLGDAGLGKTTLATAFAARAESDGFTVGWGRCPEGEALPYWPWRQALRGIDPAMPLAAVAPAGRPAMFGDIADRLTRATELRPAAIILEDIHIADGPSLALLQFLIGVLPELHCVLLLTSRDNPVDLLPASVEVLRSLPAAFGRLTLAGLDRSETAELVQQILGTPAAQLADTVFERTGGNPFFVQELARLHAARGGGSGVGPPAGVGQVVGRRLARLPQQTHDCLVAAAVLGDDARLTQLATVAQLPVGDVLELLEAAVAARLVVLDGARYRFAHALVREVLYDAVGSTQRALLHARAGEAIIGGCCSLGVHVPRYGLPLAPCCSNDGVQANAARVADHFRRATGQPAAEQAGEYALIAARAAMSRAGYEQAVRLYQWALDAPVDDEPTIRLELGEAQVLSGEMSTGRAALRQVARDCVAASDGETSARAILAMGGGAGGFEVDLFDVEQHALVERALALLPDGDSVIKATALARAALGRSNADEDARRFARAAVEMAHRLGDARAEAAAIAAWCDTASGPDYVVDRAREARRMLALAAADGEVTLALLARRLLVVALLERGDFYAADEHIAAYARVADQLHAPFFSWPVPIWRGMRALMSGDLAQTEANLSEAADLAARAESTNADLMVFTLRVAKADATGTMPGCLELIDEVFSPFWEAPMAQAYGAYFLLKAGERERASRLLAQRLAEGLTDFPKDAEWLTSVALLGETGRLMGNREVVSGCRDALRPYQHLWTYDGVGAACYGPVADFLTRFDRFLGSPVASTAPGKQAGELSRTGAGWTVVWREQTVTVADSKGVRDLAALLARPRTPVHVLDLLGVAQPAVHAGCGPVLDEPARAAYKTRLRELAEDIAEAEEFRDAGRLERLRAEHDFIAHELAAALGLGGRSRVAGDPVERARKAVSMRIGAAIKMIDGVHPSLGRHLRASVRTGRHCVYEPEHDVSWQI